MDFSLLQAVLTGAITFGIVYYLVPVLIRFAYKRDIYDKPDDERKIHTRYISSLGGVAIFIGIFVGFSVSGFADAIPGFGYLAAALLMLFFTGMKDDIVGLSAGKKLTIESLSAALIMAGCGALIVSFNGVLGIYSLWMAVSVPLTLFTIVVIMNAFNLIDGIDGLAGGIGAIASLFFAAGFFAAGVPAMGVLAVFTAIALIAFLLHNFNPARIFMGDTGSLVVGFLLAFFAVQYVQLHELAAFTSVFANGAAVLPVAFLAVPLFDTLMVFCKRKWNGNNPFKPSNDHVHHQMLDIGFSQKQVALYLYTVTIFISFTAIALAQFNNNLTLAVILFSAFATLPTNGAKRHLLRKAGLFDVEKWFRKREAIRELTQSRTENRKAEKRSRTVREAVEK